MLWDRFVILCIVVICILLSYISISIINFASPLSTGKIFAHLFTLDLRGCKIASCKLWYYAYPSSILIFLSLILSSICGFLKFPGICYFMIPPLLPLSCLCAFLLNYDKFHAFVEKFVLVVIDLFSLCMLFLSHEGSQLSFI